MIPVSRAAEPPSFRQTVRLPGVSAIRELTGKSPLISRSGPKRKPIATRPRDIPAKKFPTFWVECLPDLMVAYNSTCAYSCFRIHEVTGSRSVDHFAAKSQRWDKVYRWNNYRLAASLLNSRKGDFADVLDPFDIKVGWFQLELVGFQVLPNRNEAAGVQTSVQQTIDRLQLNDPQLRARRLSDAETYRNQDCSLATLQKESPFVAFELKRQGRLNAGD
jgi:hypothetical protein